MAERVDAVDDLGDVLFVIEICELKDEDLVVVGRKRY